jgi:hypothetical protein
LNADTNFRAVVHNSGSSASSGITATFSIADFGIAPPYTFSALPVTGGPTSTAVSVPPTATATATVGPMTTAQAAPYASHLHQCIRVELNSSDPNTTFLERSATRNMDFGYASQFIGGFAVQDTPGARYLIQVIKQPHYAYANTVFSAKYRGQLVSEYDLIYIGYRFTNQTVTRKGQTYTILEHINSVGFVIDHPMDATYQQQFESRHPEFFRQTGIVTVPGTTGGTETTTGGGTVATGGSQGGVGQPQGGSAQPGAPSALEQQMAARTRLIAAKAIPVYGPGGYDEPLLLPETSANDKHDYRVINAELKKPTEEQPEPGSWTHDDSGFAQAGLEAVPGSSDWYTLTIPAKSRADVPVNVSNNTGTVTPPCGCNGCNGGGGTCVPAAGLVLADWFRKRRRQKRSA